MAVRTTQQVLEVARAAGARAVRETQLVAEAASGDGARRLRVTQLVLEVTGTPRAPGRTWVVWWPE